MTPQTQLPRSPSARYPIFCPENLRLNKSCSNKKAPREKWGSVPFPFSRRARANAGGGRSPDFRPFRCRVKIFRAAIHLRKRGHCALRQISDGTALPGSLAKHSRSQWANRTSQRRPITVAGPWPIFTAFPFPRPNQFSFAVYAARRVVSTVRNAWKTTLNRKPLQIYFYVTGVRLEIICAKQRVSDSSTSARVSQPARASLPANLRGRKARLRKSSLNCARRRATKVPCCRELLASPWSAPVRTAP